MSEAGLEESQELAEARRAIARLETQKLGLEDMLDEEERKSPVD